MITPPPHLLNRKLTVFPDRTDFDAGVVYYGLLIEGTDDLVGENLTGEEARYFAQLHNQSQAIPKETR